MTVRGIEAIEFYMHAAQSDTNTDIEEHYDRESPSTMTSVERYRQEWTQLLNDLDENPKRIRESAYNGDLKVSKFRSIYWALLLRVLNEDYRSWSEQRAQQRKRYEELQKEFVKNPHENDVKDDNPLSQSTQSIWNQYFSDQELFAVIRQDVVRTSPGVDFFRKPLIQDAMSNILFYYAREHPYMCYRQGMHEILAPILFVIYGDHQSLLHFREIVNADVDGTLLDVMHPDYLESDSYSIFSRVMASTQSYYRISNLQQSQNSYFPQQPDISQGISAEVEVIGQLNLIRDKILAKEDLHLHNYLTKLDIPLHLFGIRWLRLLFGREFALLELLMLWDAIFADSDRFHLPNYILVAMLIHIRDRLLFSDYTTCLTYLMRYPTNVDIGLILRHALHMQMPKEFDRPPNAFVYCTMKPDNTVVHTSSAANGHNLNYAQAHQREASMSDSAKVNKQIKLLQAKNAADSAAMARINNTAESDRVIMDGYTENSPELIRLELRNAQTVITVARSKLQKYLTELRRHVSHNNSKEVAKTLDGIEELCSFLDVRVIFPLHARTIPIDQAFEANEPTPRQNKSLPKARTGVVLKQQSTLSTDMSETDELLASKDSDNFISNTNITEVGGTAYERPDNGFMLHSARILGDLKEIELISIASDEKVAASENSPSNGTDQHGDGLPVVDPVSQHKD